MEQNNFTVTQILHAQCFFPATSWFAALFGIMSKSYVALHNIHVLVLFGIMSKSYVALHNIHLSLWIFVVYMTLPQEG